MYLPFDGANGAQKIVTGWLAKAPDGVQREAQVKYGEDGAETGTALVMLREQSVQVDDTTEARGSAETPEPGG